MGYPYKYDKEYDVEVTTGPSYHRYFYVCSKCGMMHLIDEECSKEEKMRGEWNFCPFCGRKLK